MRLLLLLSTVALAFAGCAMPQPTRNPPAPTSTGRAFPTFPARHTRTPWPTAVPAPSTTPTLAPATPPAVPATAAVTASADGARGGPPAAATISHMPAPATIQSALLSQGINSNVYWFDSGGEPQLMIQYDSPIRNRPGYADMLEKVKQVAAQHFLRIDPALYTLWIAATDMTGTSDTVLRLDRHTVERWSHGEIGNEDFYNNGFVPARIVITCDAGGCAGVRPTPYPTFPSFPFPFPTPTP